MLFYAVLWIQVVAVRDFLWVGIKAHCSDMQIWSDMLNNTRV